MSVGGVGGGRRGDFEPEGTGDAEKVLPRSGWKDSDALERTVGETRGQVDAERSRPNHRLKWVEARRTSSESVAGAASTVLSKLTGTGRTHAGGKPDRPVIVAKYGVPFHGPGGGGGGTHPVIVAKYGGPFPGPGGGWGPTNPVIVAKYGVPFPGPGGGGGHHPTHPVIVAKYGVPFPGPGGGGGGGTHPVIVAKYGVPFPGPSTRNHR